MSNRNWLIHISHEAVRPLGGIGIYTRELINTAALRGKFGNNIVLAGPLIFPEEGDCRTSTNLITLKKLKKMAKSGYACLYPAPLENRSLMIDRFRDIESVFDVHIYLYQGKKHEDNWNVNILLIDNSSVFGQYFIRSRFFNEIVSRINFQMETDLYPLPVHPDKMDIRGWIRQELLNHSSDELSKSLCEEMEHPLAKMPYPFDYDYILGLLIAEPMARAISALCEPADELLVMTNDYFGLPSLYFAKRERPQHTQTMLYVNEVSPARHLVEQKIPNSNALPLSTNTVEPLDEKNPITIGDNCFYNILAIRKNSDMSSTFNKLAYLFKDAETKYAEKVKEFNLNDQNRGKYAHSAKLCQDAVKALDVSDHSSSRVFSLTKEVDIIAANGFNSKEELLWLTPPSLRLPFSEISIIPHGLVCSLKEQEPASKKPDAKREIFRILNNYDEKRISVVNGPKIEGEFHSEYQDDCYLFIKISRPIMCKAFDRDLKVCQHIDRYLGNDNKRAIFLVISSWDTNQKQNPIRGWVNSCENNRIKNISFLFINQFDWPTAPNVNRETLLWASDVSFSQSRYESFGLAQIEPLQYATICLVAGVSGARCYLEENAQNMLDDPDCPVIVADYVGKKENAGSSESEIFTKNWEKDEEEKAKELATRVYERLTNTTPEVLYEKGYKMTQIFQWEQIAEKFLKVIETK